jgi:hypothetical protein
MCHPIRVGTSTAALRPLTDSGARRPYARSASFRSTREIRRRIGSEDGPTSVFIRDRIRRRTRAQVADMPQRRTPALSTRQRPATRLRLTGRKLAVGISLRFVADRLRGTPKRGLGQPLAKNLPLLVGKVRGIFRPFRVGHRYDSFRSVAGNRKVSYRFLSI